MFERYNEEGRRSIFFARYEASHLGLQEITPDSLLLGILRENHDIAGRWFGMATWELCEAVVRRVPSTGKQVATSVDMPISSGGKRVLDHAAEEADRMGHPRIGTEHLFLALLREPASFAALTLKERGVTIEQLRAEMAKDAVRPKSGVWRGGQRLILQLEDGSEVANLIWSSRTPSIGESIMLSKGANGETLYRILDVRWHLQESDNTIVTSEHPTFSATSVVLVLRKEQARS